MKKIYNYIYNQRSLTKNDIPKNIDHKNAILLAKKAGYQIDTDDLKVYADGFLIAYLKK